MAWKQRLYAFLLRRFLGPLLTKESNDELSNCIELSFQEGHFLLKNTSLEPGYLTNIIQRKQVNDKIVGGLQVDKIFLQKLSIQLSIRSTSISAATDQNSGLAGSSENASAGSLSVMKKLVQLRYKKGSMALYAFIDIEGVEIHISPMDEHKTVDDRRDLDDTIQIESEMNQDQQESEKGYFASIVDSAVKSLRLNVAINNFHVRFVKPPTTSNPMTKSWLGVSINSISYRDQNPDNNQSCLPTLFNDKNVLQDSNLEQNKYDWKEILGKLMEISGFSLQISSSDLNPTKTRTIIGTNGFSTIHLRAFTANQEDPGKTTHNEILISMNEHIAINLDPKKIQILYELSHVLNECLSNSLQTHPASEEILVDNNPNSTDPFIHSSSLHVEKLYSNQGIMQRYEEAHHFALTRELRGGIILPASYGEDDGAKNFIDDSNYDESEFDTFFDCNETSFSQFLSNFNADSATDSLKCENKDFFHTYVHFYLHEASLKTSFTALDDRSSAYYEEYVAMSFQQLEASATLSETKCMISMRLSHFEIGDAMLTSFHTTTRDSEYVDVGHILRFSQDDDSNRNSFIDTPFCISISVATSSRIDEMIEKSETSKDISFDISCQPIEITYRPKTLKNIANLANLMGKNNTKNSKIASDVQKTSRKKDDSFLLSIRFPEIIFIIPFDESKTKSQEIHSVFSRAGHILHNAIHQPALCIAFLNSSVDHGNSSGFTILSETCTLYISVPSGVLENEFSTVLEILSLSSDPTISKESILKVNFHEKYKNVGFGEDKIKSSFPIVPLLSSVKARQEENSGDHAIRGDNPQISMMNDAERCNFYLNIQVPYLVIDVHSMEQKVMTKILSSIEPIQFDEHDKPDSSSTAKESKKQNQLSIGFNCEQLSMSYHHKETINNLGNKEFTIFTVIDNLKCHAVTGGAGLQNLRCLSQDFTVYEATRIHQNDVESQNYFKNNQYVRHGKKLRARGLNGLEDVTPIFHRSNLAYPLSPETPLFLLDVIMNADCDYSNEIQIHFSVYDLTYRYALDSIWFQRFLSIIQDTNESDLDEEESQKSLKSEKEESSPVIKLFVTLSDNVIDYTPPIHNFHPSRTLIRIGEIRLSCNLIFNTSIQAYKASVADVAVYICNWRFPYHTENLRLSCSRQIMNMDDSHNVILPTNVSKLRYASVEEVLEEMNFISIANLDSLDANVRIQTNDYAKEKSNVKNDQADVMVTLTMGQLSLYTCKDSFTCMTQTIDEWVLEFTALSDEEIESLKQSVIPTNQINTENLETSNTEVVNINAETYHTEPASKWNLLDAIDDDIFMEKRKPTEMYVPEDNQIMESKNILPFANVPDSELSATELRKKHGLLQLDKDISDMAESLLIKNFYVIKPNGLSGDAFKNENEEAAVMNYDEIDTSEFEEDEWTTIDRTWSRTSKSDDNSESSEQKAKWFTDVDTDLSANESIPEIKIYPHHVPITKLKEDPVLEESMDAAQYAGTVVNPNVKFRLFVKNLDINCRFFDGNDWNNSADILAGTRRNQKNSISTKRKDELMNELLFDDFLEVGDKHFDEIPVVTVPHICRQTNCFFQFLFEGIIARIDSYAETKDHRLASCLRLKVNDFSLIEAISSTRPKKMLGEWVNEVDHPRDSDDGVIMVETISMKPICRFSADGKILSDESVAKLDLLPLRCYIDQKALRFIKAFFSSNKDDQSSETDLNGDSKMEPLVMGTFFKSFDVTSTKLKVNYNPIGVDMVALKDGSYSELLNLFPLEGMELYLQPLQIHNLIGWGACLGETSSRWIEDIASSQIHKFIAGASPFHTISNVSEGMADMVLIPIHNYKYHGGKHMGRAVRKGTSKFASTVAAEALDNTSKLTKHLAVGLTELSPLKNGSDMFTVLPSRPERAPHSIGDTVEHAYESVSKGLRTANYTIIVVPRREYQKNGTTGAVKSVIRALPIAILAPLSGASEALSYSLLGMRNQLRPEILKEEEASRRGILKS